MASNSLTQTEREFVYHETKNCTKCSIYISMSSRVSQNYWHQSKTSELETSKPIWEPWFCRTERRRTEIESVCSKRKTVWNLESGEVVMAFEIARFLPRSSYSSLSCLFFKAWKRLDIDIMNSLEGKQIFKDFFLSKSTIFIKGRLSFVRFPGPQYKCRSKLVRRCQRISIKCYSPTSQSRKSIADWMASVAAEMSKRGFCDCSPVGLYSNSDPPQRILIGTAICHDYLHYSK